MNLSKLKYIYWWLVVCLTLVFTMVFIGGLTRLTDSGLSMVEWNIISGIFPPILNSDWIELFDKYKKKIGLQIQTIPIPAVEYIFLGILSLYYFILWYTTRKWFPAGKV